MTQNRANAVTGVTAPTILKLLSHYNNIDDILRYDCPRHLQKSVGLWTDNLEEKPDYVGPSELRVSTMTTICYVSTKVHMLPLFYMMPCLDKKHFDPTKNETLLIGKPRKGKVKRKRDEERKKEIFNRGQHRKYLQAFLQSNWLRIGRKYNCPLSEFVTRFSQYCDSRRFQNNMNQYAQEQVIEDIASFIKQNQKNGIQIVKIPPKNVLVYPKVQSFYENAVHTLTQYYDPKEYKEGEYVILGLDVVDVFPAVLDIRHQNLARGNVKLAVKKKASSKAFYNQCTMRIALENYNSVINMKMFKNGKLQMTGCKSIKNVEDAIRFLTYQLEMISYKMHFQNRAMLEMKLKHFTNPLPEHIHLSRDIWQNVFKYVSPYILLGWSRVSKSFYRWTHDESFWVNRIEKEFLFKTKKVEDNKWKIIEKYNPRYGCFKKLYRDMNFLNPILFYATTTGDKPQLPFIPLDKDSSIELIDVEIAMINSDFETHFYIDQIRLANILKNQYKLFVKFDPINYPGVNIKYDSYTILVFRTGKVIITGAKKYESIEEGYRFINGVFEKHYHDIWSRGDGD